MAGVHEEVDVGLPVGLVPVFSRFCKFSGRGGEGLGEEGEREFALVPGEAHGRDVDSELAGAGALKTDVKGFLMRTRTGELTVHVAPIHLPGHEGKPALTFLAKAMLALPDKYHGLEDTELRYRQRYVDLFMNTGNSPKPAIQSSVILSEATAGSEVEGPAVPASEADGPGNVREVFVSGPPSCARCAPSSTRTAISRSKPP